MVWACPTNMTDLSSKGDVGASGDFVPIMVVSAL